MRQFLIASAAALMLATPAAPAEQDALPEDGRSLIEKGARMFFEGLMQEAGPAMKDLQELAERLGPQLRSFAQEMGPALADILRDIDDLSVYERPQILPNGDIIIRRKPSEKAAPDMSPGTRGEDEIEI